MFLGAFIYILITAHLLTRDLSDTEKTKPLLYPTVLIRTDWITPVRTKIVGYFLLMQQDDT